MIDNQLYLLNDRDENRVGKLVDSYLAGKLLDKDCIMFESNGGMDHIPLKVTHVELGEDFINIKGLCKFAVDPVYHQFVNDEVLAAELHRDRIILYTAKSIVKAPPPPDPVPDDNYSIERNLTSKVSERKQRQMTINISLHLNVTEPIFDRVIDWGQGNEDAIPGWLKKIKIKYGFPYIPIPGTKVTIDRDNRKLYISELAAISLSEDNMRKLHGDIVKVRLYDYYIAITLRYWPRVAITDKAQCPKKIDPIKAACILTTDRDVYDQYKNIHDTVVFVELDGNKFKCSIDGNILTIDGEHKYDKPSQFVREIFWLKLKA